MSLNNEILHIYIYKTLRYVSVQSSAVSGLQEGNNLLTQNMSCNMSHDTKYCCCRATCLSGHIVNFTTHINRLYTIPSIVGGTLQSFLNLIQYVKVLRGVTTAEPCERALRNRRRNSNESLVEKSNRLRYRNETFKIC
jgi:hypothetical protein